jgi:hypothetical protein
MAEALQMGTWTHAANRLRNAKNKNVANKRDELGLV